MNEPEGRLAHHLLLIHPVRDEDDDQGGGADPGVPGEPIGDGGQKRDMGTHLFSSCDSKSSNRKKLDAALAQGPCGIPPSFCSIPRPFVCQVLYSRDLSCV